MPVYAAGPGASSGRPLIRLDSNENPYGPSPRAVEAMRMALSSSNFYPDDNSADLRHQLAVHHGMPEDQILVTAGSTDMIAILCQTLLGPGRNAVTSERSFIVYPLAVRATGADLIQTPMREDSFDLEAILAAIDENTRLIFVANPNNPTGTILDSAAIDNFLSRVPDHVIVVLDEAYYEFAAHFAFLRGCMYSNSLHQVKRGAPVVVLRTFSKAHGLAGLRIGYGIGPADLFSYCVRMRHTYSVSSVAQAAALAAMRDQAHIDRAVTSNSQQSKILCDGLAELGMRVFPTSANFICCDVAEDAAAYTARLREYGISVRPLGFWGAPNSIRISIGTPEQNQALLAAAQKISNAR